VSQLFVFYHHIPDAEPLRVPTSQSCSHFSSFPIALNVVAMAFLNSIIFPQIKTKGLTSMHTVGRYGRLIRLLEEAMATAEALGQLAED
jgi:hypothetical protein